MRMRKTHAALLALVCLIPLGTLRAWERAPAAAPDTTTRGVVPLRVEITFARTEAARKTDNRSYVLWVNTEDGPATLKTGVEVPVAVTSFTPPESAKPSTSYQYRNVGVNLKCTATAVGDGRYKVDLEFEQSSSPEGPRGPTDLPTFRTAGGHFRLVLRDGQSGEADIATNPAGEGLRLQAALHVVN